MGFFDVFKSIFRGGAVKNLGKKAVKGIKGLFTKGGSKVAKGLKRGGVKVVRGLKKTKAQAKAIPETITKGKELYKLTKTMNRPLKERVSMTKTFMKNNLNKVGKEALRKDGLERLATKLQKNVIPVVKLRAKDATLKKLLKNSRAGESWSKWLGRNGSKLGSQAKGLVQTIIREGGENLAVDATLGLGQKLLVGTATAGVSAGATAGIVEGTK